MPLQFYIAAACVLLYTRLMPYKYIVFVENM